MKKRFLAFALVIVTVAAVFSGCASKPYDYDNYEQYIKIGNPDGIKINKSDIEDGILEKFHSLFDTSKLETKTYTKAEDNVFIQKGDVANIDYTGKKDGVKFDGGTATGYDLTIGSNQFIDGFEDGLIGYTVGDSVDLNLTFPEDYGNAELKGQAVVFTVKINSIKRTNYPAYTDATIKENSTFETVKEFEDSARDTVIKNLLWQEFYSDCKIVKYPKEELEKYYNQGIKSIEQYATMYGMTLSSYVANYYGYSDIKTFYNAMATQAQSTVKQELIVLRFVEAYPELKFTEEKFEEEVKALYDEYKANQSYDKSYKKFKKEFDRKTLEITLYYDVVINYIKDRMVENDDVTKNGFVTDRGGVRYYENDVMIKGWKQIDSKLYYFDKETGYAPKNNSTLVVAPNGETEEKCLKFGENGLYEGLYTGFKSDRYYKDGVMQTGEQTIGEGTDAKTYYFDPETGIMVKSNVAEIEAGVYYKYDENGVKQGKANGLVYADQTTRFFNNGTLIKGWLKYTVTENEGTAVETVEAITDITNVAANDNCYYTDSETGVMVKGETKEIGGKNYTFNENGLCTEISDAVSE